MDWILVQEELDFIFWKKGSVYFVAMKFQPLETQKKIK